LGGKALEAGHQVLFLFLEAPLSRLVGAKDENRPQRLPLLHHATTINIKGESSKRWVGVRELGLSVVQPGVTEGQSASTV
jgi:hypothetical protein